MEKNKIETGFSSDAKKEPRRVVFVTKKTSAKVVGDPGPQLMTYPHLLIREAIAFQVLVIAMVLVALFWDAPLEQLANPLLTPNPAKAPWYFLGLQAESRQGSLVFSRPSRAAALFPALRRGNIDSDFGGDRARGHSLFQREYRRRGDLGPAAIAKSQDCPHHRVRPARIPCRIPCLDNFRTGGARCGSFAFFLCRQADARGLVADAGRQAALLVGHDVVHCCRYLFDRRGDVFQGPGLVLGLAVENSCRLKIWAN